MRTGLPVESVPAVPEEIPAPEPAIVPEPVKEPEPDEAPAEDPNPEVKPDENGQASSEETEEISDTDTTGETMEKDLIEE